MMGLAVRGGEKQPWGSIILPLTLRFVRHRRRRRRLVQCGWHTRGWTSSRERPAVVTGDNDRPGPTDEREKTSCLSFSRWRRSVVVGGGGFSGVMRGVSDYRGCVGETRRHGTAGVKKWSYDVTRMDTWCVCGWLSNRSNLAHRTAGK